MYRTANHRDSAPARPRHRSAGDNAGAYPAVDRARDLLGWTPAHSVQEGIAAALAWNGARRTVLGG